MEIYMYIIIIIGNDELVTVLVVGQVTGTAAADLLHETYCKTL